MSDLSEIGGGRPVRFCPVCKVADDHPRHVIGDGGSADVARHMDCCREVGCPDGSCVAVTEGAEGLRGLDLLEHIEHLDPVAVAHRIAELPTDPEFVLDNGGQA